MNPGELLSRLLFIWPFLVFTVNIATIFVPLLLLNPVDFKQYVASGEQILFRPAQDYQLSTVKFTGSPDGRLIYTNAEPTPFTVPFNSTSSVTVGRKKSSEIASLDSVVFHRHVVAGTWLRIQINARSDSPNVPAYLGCYQNGMEVTGEIVEMNSSKEYAWQFKNDGTVMTTISRSSPGETVIGWTLKTEETRYKISTNTIVNVCAFALQPQCAWNSSSGTYVISESMESVDGGYYLGATGRYTYPKQLGFDIWEILIVSVCFVLVMIAPTPQKIKEKIMLKFSDYSAAGSVAAGKSDMEMLMQISEKV